VLETLWFFVLVWCLVNIDIVREFLPSCPPAPMFPCFPSVPNALTRQSQNILLQLLNQPCSALVLMNPHNELDVPKPKHARDGLT
jgi:hypothetical protein